MTITLITGANKGLGFETARRLVLAGHSVYLGARDPGRGRVAAETVGARFIELDVTSDESVDAAARDIQRRDGRLDVLINNAGIAGDGAKPLGRHGRRPRARVRDQRVRPRARHARDAARCCLKSDDPVIVNVASGLGSIGVVTDKSRLESNFPTIAYSSSKSAVTMLTVQYAKAFPEIRINVVDPGYTATDLNGNRGHQSVDRGHGRHRRARDNRVGRPDGHLPGPQRHRALVAVATAVRPAAQFFGPLMRQARQSLQN